MDSSAVIACLQRYFETRSDVVAVYLFGSVARGVDTPKSDVDVGIFFGSFARDELQRLGDLEDIRADLETMLARTVDVIAVDRASPDFLHRMLRDGIVIADHDHQARLEFEVKARNEYFDLLPILERYRASVLERL
ncbi:MAG: nucleotidyltransferase domain-containing protein [Planctomycetes bacterium]|nr:nucleotidyltransferase domain-containing protein [Planctomycetota bacterium]